MCGYLHPAKLGKTNKKRPDPFRPCAVPGAATPLATTRQDELFYRQIPVPNTQVAVRAEITLNAMKPAAGAGGSDLVAVTTRSAYVAKTPEVFTHDLDGNLQADARWNYTWDAENRLVGLATSTPARAAGVPRTQLTMVYDGRPKGVWPFFVSYWLS
jgi:hypothetical protein